MSIETPNNVTKTPGLGEPNAAVAPAPKRLWIFLGISCWFLLTFFHQRNYDFPTPVSRLNLIMAICLEGRFEIDSFHGNTPDKAFVNGHYYSDKAPGTVALALIGSAPAIWIGQAYGLTADDKELWLLASWAGCAVLNFLLATGFVCMVRLLWELLCSRRREEAQASPSGASASSVVETDLSSFRIALATTIFIIFGGMAWPYATMMFSHAQAIGCIAIGMWFLHRADPTLFSLSTTSRNLAPSPTLSSHSPLVLAGFSFAWALNSEYTTGLMVFGIPLIAFGLHWRPWIWLLLGLAGPCLLIPFYSWATIGVPWQLPYSYQAAFPEMKEGLYAIKWPNAAIAWNLLLSPERGLLFWSPFLAVAIFGYAAISHNKRLFLMTYVLPVLQIAVISGRVWDWPAGPAFGARYLAPILPLLAIPCALALRNWRYFAGLLGVLSLALVGTATITNATPQFNKHDNPLLTLNLPLMSGLDFNHNLLSHLSGADAILGVLAFVLFSFLLLWIIQILMFRWCKLWPQRSQETFSDGSTRS